MRIASSCAQVKDHRPHQRDRSAVILSVLNKSTTKQENNTIEHNAASAYDVIILSQSE